MKFLIKTTLSLLLCILQGLSVEPSLFENLVIDELPAYSVHIKNVEQGSCTIVRNHENDHYLIIDAGSSSSEPANKDSRIGGFFGFSQENPDVPFSENTVSVIVSHSDEDHINLFKIVFGLNQNLLNRVNKLIFGDHLDNYFRLNTERTKPVQETRAFIKDFMLRVPNYTEKLLSLSHEEIDTLDFEDLLTRDFVEITVPYKGFSTSISISRKYFFSDDQPGGIEFLGVNSGAESDKIKDTNTNSAVARLCINGKYIIVMGDATGHTTGKILENIVEPESLKAVLLIASHHGADNEKANHITWAAVTTPKHVAISHGFSGSCNHPTLTAVANFMVMGLMGEEEIQKDTHILSVFNTPGTRVLGVMPFGMKRAGFKKGHPEWFNFSTDRPIYGTGTSGDLLYVFSRNGSLINFKREY